MSPRSPCSVSRPTRSSSSIDAPPIVIGARYAPKTIDLCVPGDPVCTPGGNNNVGHGMYAADGMTRQAADFAAHRL